MATQAGGSVTSRAASESRSGPPGSSGSVPGNSTAQTATGAKFRHGLLQLMIHTIDPLHDGKVHRTLFVYIIKIHFRSYSFVSQNIRLAFIFFCLYLFIFCIVCISNSPNFIFLTLLRFMSLSTFCKQTTFASKMAKNEQFDILQREILFYFLSTYFISCATPFHSSFNLKIIFVNLFL